VAEPRQRRLLELAEAELGEVRDRRLAQAERDAIDASSASRRRSLKCALTPA